MSVNKMLLFLVVLITIPVKRNYSYYCQYSSYQIYICGLFDLPQKPSYILAQILHGSLAFFITENSSRTS